MDWRQRGAAALLLVALAACAATPATAEHKIYINWLAHNNYSDWARSHGPFNKGDYLVFYTPEELDVVEVNEHGYDSCDPRHPINRYSHLREIAIELSEAKVYYFICSAGRYCPDGMRLAIEVHEMPASARHNASDTAMLESSATSLAPGPRASSEGQREGQRRGGGSDDSDRLLQGRMEKKLEDVSRTGAGLRSGP